MAEPSLHPAGHGDGASSLFELVSTRVSAAESSLRNLPSKSGTTRPTRALWRVFHEFGSAYRRQRRESGVGPLEDVRDAAEAFRRAPTLTSLVAVASVLDGHGLMSRSA